MKVDFDDFYASQFEPNKDFYQFLANKAKDMGILENEFIKHYYPYSSSKYVVSIQNQYNRIINL